MPNSLFVGESWLQRKSSLHVDAKTEGAAMPLYFFNIRDGRGYVADDEGIDLADLAAARSEARAGAVDMIVEWLRNEHGMRAETVFEVTDHTGSIVETLRFQDILSDAAPDFS
jgi:hypothetical protein